MLYKVILGFNGFDWVILGLTWFFGFSLISRGCSANPTLWPVSAHMELPAGGIGPNPFPSVFVFVCVTRHSTIAPYWISRSIRLRTFQSRRLQIRRRIEYVELCFFFIKESLIGYRVQFSACQKTARGCHISRKKGRHGKRKASAICRGFGWMWSITALTETRQFVGVGRVDDVDEGLQFELAARLVDAVELDDGVAEGGLHLVGAALEDGTFIKKKTPSGSSGFESRCWDRVFLSFFTEFCWVGSSTV